jgi:hypothetical protein
MTVGEMIKALQKFPETDKVEVFIGDLENKRMSTLSMSSAVQRCPVKFGSMTMMDHATTVWVVG